MGFRALLLAVLAIVLVAGCGSDDAPAPEPPERKEESADTVPDLKRGYEEFVNRSAGVAFGRPPGWSAKEQGATTDLVAPDELVSAAITVDRTDEAIGGEPKAFATQTLKLLPGYEMSLEPSEAKPFDHPYDGAIVAAKGVSEKTGVTQNVQVIVLVRQGAAVVTAVIAENAERSAAGAEAKQALESVRTLRTRPPA